MTDAEIDNFLENFYPGTWNGTSQDVIVETHDLHIDLSALTNERNENDKRIMRGIGIPSFIMGFEDVTNRATSEQVLNAWRESELNDRRTWLQDQLEPQWFDMIITNEFPDVDVKNLRIKAKMEFEDITFETLADKTSAVVPLYQAGIVPLEKVLKLLDMEDVLEQVLAQQAIEQKLRMQELKIKQQELDLRQKQVNSGVNAVDNPNQQQQAPPNGNGNGNGNGKAETPRAVLTPNKKASLDEVAPKPTIDTSALQAQFMREEHAFKIELLKKRMSLMDSIDERIRRENS